MIQIHRKKNDDGIEIEFESTSPFIFPDQWALKKMANSEEASLRFHKAIKDRGTLFLTIPHLLEMMQTSGEDFEKLKKFFDSVGGRWLPIEFRPDIIFEMEHKNEGILERPLFNEAFCREYFPHLNDGDVSFSSAIEFMRGHREMADGYKKDLATQTEELMNLFRAGRPPVTNLPKSPSAILRVKLIQEMMSGKMPFKDSDSVDMMHAVIGANYAQVVCLDKKWNDLIKKTKVEVKAKIVSSVEELLGLLGQ